MNDLIDRARGEFIARYALRRHLPAATAGASGELSSSQSERVVVGCQALIIDPDGDSICIWFQGQTHEELDAQNLQGDRQSSLCHPAVMMRRQTVLDVGKYRERELCEDLDLWLRLAERGRLANLPIVLLKYRIHQSNLLNRIHQSDKSNQRLARAVRDFQTILTEARLRRGLPVGELPAGPQGRANTRSSPSMNNGDGRLWEGDMWPRPASMPGNR